MAFETESGNVTKPDATISAIAAPAFVETSKALAHGLVLNYGGPSTIKFNKDGSFTAGTLAESTAYTFDSGDEFSQTSVSCTAQTYVHIFKPSIQSERFSDGQADLSKLGRLQGEAIARAFDATWIGLFPSITNLVTEVAGATKDGLLDAQYTVHNATMRDVRLHVVISRKARNELRKEITSITASAFGTDKMLDLIGGPIQANGLVGEFSDMLVFNTSGFTTTGGDNQQAVFDPTLAFGMGVDQTIYTRSVFKASEGLFTEVASWMFANAVLWNDSAACEYRSDS